MLGRLSLLAVLVMFCADESRAEAVRLAWDPVPEGFVTGYNVYRSETPGGPYIRLNESPVSMPSFPDTSVEGGKTYYYVVTSVGSGGTESRYSAELKVTLQTFDPVSARDTLVASAGSDLSARSGQLVTLSAGGFQPDGKNLTYRWTQVSGPPVTIARSDRAEASFLAPITTQDTRFVFALTITTVEGSSAPDFVAVVVRKASSAN